jgi:membrane protease YdiL (CAAX protease family)
MAVPSVAFGLLHLEPSSGGAATGWLIVLGATIFGLMAADLTSVTGSLGAAWGLHFANNVFAVALVAMQGTITGLSLYTTPFAMADAPPVLFALDMGLLALVWLVCRRALER